MELSPGSGGRGSGGASSRRHVRSSRRRLRNHDAISLTGGAASTTRRRRETSHSTTLSTPRCQGGWRQLEYTRVIISPSAHPRTAGRHAGDPQHGPGPASTPQSRGHIIRGWRTGLDTPGPSRAPEPVRPSTIQGSNPLVHPRDGGPERSARALMLPRYRPDHAQSPHLTRHTSGGRPAKELGHSSCPGIGLPRPAHHPSLSGRRAGE